MEKQSKYLTPFQRKLLKANLEKKGLSPDDSSRIRIMLLADEGLTRTQICQTLRCSVKTARYWIAKAKAGEAHNWQNYLRGRPKIINEEYIAFLRELATNSPRDYGYPFKYWTGQWLSKHLNKELGIKVSSRHVNRLLKQMGLSKRQKSVDSDAKITGNNIEDNSLKLRELSSVSSLEPFPKWQLNILG